MLTCDRYDEKNRIDHGPSVSEREGDKVITYNPYQKKKLIFVLDILFGCLRKTTTVLWKF